MTLFAFAKRRPVSALVLVAGLTAGGLLATKRLGYDLVPDINTVRISSMFESMSRGAETETAEEPHHEHHRILVTSPKVMDVTLTQPYVCQIHSQRHINVCNLEPGYLQEILVKEGQEVKQGQLLFKILPTLYQARLEAETAEAKLAELEFLNTRNLASQNVVSQNEVKLLKAKLDKAQAKVKLAQAELGFTQVVAPFDGIVDRLRQQLGSLVKEGDVLTTLSDNRVMWVYFNVPERGYLEYMNGLNQHDEERIELVLASGEKFPHAGKIGAIEAKFNNETGNIPFRADFPNPDGLLRHGQTGTVLISRVLKGALTIPQRATFENLAKRYVFVVDEDNVVHQREIEVQNVLEDIYVLKKGVLAENEKIVLEGIRELHENETVEFEFLDPEEVLAHPKYRAE